ncbi:MAG: J domain-containing protein [Acidimicrobiales bacterium]
MSLYDVLGVPPTADDTAMRRAYLSLARRHHPDVVGGDPARMQLINEAWATLSDPIQRARYDRSVAPASQAAGPVAPEPRWDAFEDHDEIDDDHAIRATVRLPRGVSLLPAALFALSLVTGFIGILFVSQAALGLALVELVLSCLFFLAAPFIALFASRTGGVDGRSQQ